MEFMIIRGSEIKHKKIGPMKISEYKINSDFSAALISIDGDHGAVKCIAEDRIYFILEGSGKFIINGEPLSVSSNYLVFVPKNTPYNVIGNMKYLIICSPAFDPKHDVFLE